MRKTTESKVPYFEQEISEISELVDKPGSYGIELPDDFREWSKARGSSLITADPVDGNLSFKIGSDYNYIYLRKGDNDSVVYAVKRSKIKNRIFCIDDFLMNNYVVLESLTRRQYEIHPLIDVIMKKEFQDIRKYKNLFSCKINKQQRIELPNQLLKDLGIKPEKRKESIFLIGRGDYIAVKPYREKLLKKFRWLG
ncbi:hypothetical protein JXA85_01680 [Candidatus Woesearchaeota archaeon]|nr:hypothetical protein [Candidatus Woesearchaeota archaeon]